MISLNAIISTLYLVHFILSEHQTPYEHEWHYKVSTFLIKFIFRNLICRHIISVLLLWFILNGLLRYECIILLTNG